MTAALIIATGTSSGSRRFMPEKELGSISAVQRIARTLQLADIKKIVVVYGEAPDDRTTKLVAHMGLEFVPGSSEREMLDNIKNGLLYLSGKCSRVLIAHANVPLFTVETVRALLLSEGDFCLPSYQGKAGHPVLLGAEHLPAILSYRGEEGLAGAVRAAGLTRCFVDVDDPGIRANTREEASFDELLEAHDLKSIRPEVTLRLAKERIFYGPGAHQLLRLTDETGSLLEACRKMGISYSKGRKIMATLEQELGYPVITGRAGGKSGGMSAVTEQGLALAARYEAFLTELKDCSRELFAKYFDDMK